MGTREELLRKREIREAGGDPYASPAPAGENEQKLVDLRTVANEVGRVHAAYEEAIMEERDLAARILSRAIEHIMPALPALVGKLEFKSVKRTSGKVDGSVSMQQVSEDHHNKRGMLIVDKFHVVQLERDVSGTYGGHGLYLLEDGHLALGDRSGDWSRVPGESSTLWLALMEVDAATVVAKYRIDQILAGMAAALNNQEHLVGATDKVRARVAKLAVALNALNDMMR